jgi:hypothetical protein
VADAVRTGAVVDGGRDHTPRAARGPPRSRRLAGMSDVMTLGDQARDALTAYEDLTSLAEDIEDEWSYVNDLSTAWQEQIEELIEKRGAESVTALEEAAISRAVDEIGRITDPHRAIDWLSTFPQMVLITLGGRS